MFRRRLVAAGRAPGLAATIRAPASAQGSLNMLCAPGANGCAAIAAAFQRDTAIRIAMTRESFGESEMHRRMQARGGREIGPLPR